MSKNSNKNASGASRKPSLSFKLKHLSDCTTDELYTTIKWRLLFSLKVYESVEEFSPTLCHPPKPKVVVLQDDLNIFNF